MTATETEQELENRTEHLKLYSDRAIYIASFFGSLIAAGILIRSNYVRLGHAQKGNKILGFCILMVLSVVGIFMFIPTDPGLDKIINLVLSGFWILLTYFIMKAEHLELLTEHKNKGNGFRSFWNVVAVSLLGLGSVVAFIMLISPLVFSEAEEQLQDDLDSFYQFEANAMQVFDSLETGSQDQLLRMVKEKSLVNVARMDFVLNKIEYGDELDLSSQRQVELLKTYTALRRESFLTMKEIFEGNDSDSTMAVAEQQFVRIDSVLSLYLDEL